MGASLCLFAVATFVPGPRQHFAAPRASLLVASAPAEGLKRAAIRTRIERLRRANLLKENEIESLKQQLGQGRRPGWQGELARATETIAAKQWRSGEVLWRRLVQQRDPLQYMLDETGAVLRLGSNLTTLLAYSAHSDKLLVHAPAIYARAKELEPHALPLIRVVDEYIAVLEPHLDEILERFPVIEPHVPYIIENADTLAPLTGPLLRHLDELLLFADEDQFYLPSLRPYVAYFAPRLDALGPHLPLIRPHLPRLLPYLPIIGRYSDNFVPHVAASANADLLLHYFGWCLRIPYLHHILSLPGVPRAVAAISRILPARPVRGPTSRFSCDWEECETSYEANAKRYYAGIPTAGEEDVQAAIEVALGRRAASAGSLGWGGMRSSLGTRGTTTSESVRGEGPEANDVVPAG